MSYSQLSYHIVTATKGRRRLISPSVEPTLFGALRDKATALGGFVREVGGDDDHIHIFVDVPAKIAVSEFVRQLKGYTAYVMNREHPLMKFAWQVGYAAFTVDLTDTAGLVAYIRNQREHHRRGLVRAGLEMPPG